MTSSMSFTSSGGMSGVSISQQTIVENGRRVTRTIRRYPDGTTETTQQVAPAPHSSARNSARLAPGTASRGWERASSNFIDGMCVCVCVCVCVCACARARVCNSSWPSAPLAAQKIRIAR